VRYATAAAAGLCVLFLAALPPVLTGLLGLPLPVKALAALVIVAPLGLCMGIPFPSGLAALSESRRDILPWAWGMNGALSVAGSVLARVISLSAGFTVVLGCVAALYVSAGLLYRANERRAEAAAPASVATRA